MTSAALTRTHRMLLHFPILMIFLVIILLSIGIGAHGNAPAIGGMLLFAIATGFTYLIALKFHAARGPVTAIADFFALSERGRIAGTWAVGLCAIVIALVHLFAFNGMTLGPALTAKSNIEVALIRQGIVENLPTSMQYLNAIAIKALFPIGFLLAISQRMKLLSLIVAAVGLFYAICMMQKSGPVLLALPVATYFLFTGRWVRLLITAAVVVGAVFFMGIVANPQIQSGAVQAVLRDVGKDISGGEPTAPKTQEVAPAIPAPEPIGEGESATVILFKALLGRVAITPGDVAAKWFSAIPADVPYGEGCGYRFLAPLLGCSFKNYSIILYDRFYPEHRAIGMRGTVNAASMMTAYANFGMLGIALSGILHGLIAWGLFVLFQRTPILSPPFNVTYLLLLSSGDLFTILLSGGWALSVLLYVFLSRPPSSTVDAL